MSDKKVDNSSKPKGAPWSLSDAMGFIESIRPKILAAGFDVGLTGSMLGMDAAGTKSDLDIIVYPLNASCFDRSKLGPIFDEYCYQLYTPGQLKVAWETLHSSDSKHVEKRVFPGGRLLDIFHLT